MKKITFVFIISLFVTSCNQEKDITQVKLEA